ncbi:MAG: recombinase family protein, partial [Waterburya sp.]
MQKAVIYARVSTQSQVNEGNGLSSQIFRCQEYATKKDYEVVQIFKDEGISGKVEQRPAIKELLAFLAQNKGCIVV